MYSNSVKTISTKLLFTGLCLVGGGAAISSAFHLWRTEAPPRIAYIDTDKLLNSYQAMITARHQYQREKQEWQHNLAILSEEAQQAAKSAQQAVTGSPAKKAAQAREAQFKREQLFNYQQALVKQEPEEMQRLTQPVIASVNRYISTYSREHQYSLVLTTAGQGDVVYSDNKLDITADVAKKLNEQLVDSLAKVSGKGLDKQLAGQP
jgi:outer membrane protein